MRAFLTDQRVMDRSPLVFPSTCTIMIANQTRNELNELVAGTPTVRPGHEAIRCNRPEYQRPGIFQEMRTDVSTYGETTYHVLLNGQFPLIAETDIAVVDGVNYNIRSITHNSVRTYTMLKLEIIS